MHNTIIILIVAKYFLFYIFKVKTRLKAKKELPRLRLVGQPTFLDALAIYVLGFMLICIFPMGSTLFLGEGLYSFIIHSLSVLWQHYIIRRIFNEHKFIKNLYGKTSNHCHEKYE